MKAYLILEDGHVFTGISIGTEKEAISEIVFNTSMTGYLEILTDPSYAGQAVVMTYPLIGNYGICPADMESQKPWPDALIVREIARTPSNFRSESSLGDFLKQYGIPGIAGIDTRALTKILREKGTMNGLITTKEYSDLTKIKERLAAYKVTKPVERVTCKEKRHISYNDFLPTPLEEAKMTYMAAPSMKMAIAKAKESGICPGRIALYAMQGAKGEECLMNLSKESDARLKSLANKGEDYEKDLLKESDAHSKSLANKGEDYTKNFSKEVEKHFRVALMDFGSKRNIEHCLLKRGCDVTVYPAFTKAEEILTGGYDGIMLSNGPGDPAECTEIIAEIKKLYDSSIPIFAICLGHQLMALANGFVTIKMKYGHRGANHPVKDLADGRVYLSSQNHGYMVTADSIDSSKAKIAFLNANDGTVEGLRYIGKKIITVQFHPEACAGPKDSEFLFDEFIQMMGQIE